MRRGKFRAFVISLMLGVFCFSLTGNLKGSTWQVYDQSSGLPGNKVTSFAVGKLQMAVGTNQGVAVFDGETCCWSVPPLPSDIASAEVRDLAFDEYGGLWMATSNGLALLPAESEATRNLTAETRQQNVIRYLVEDGLPNVDAGRIQISGSQVMAGFFGGFVCKCEVPRGGKGKFQPVNYLPSRTEDGALKIRSVGITGLAMKDATNGWFSTQGSGLIKVSGLSMTTIDQSAGLGSDWVDSFWIFPGESQSEHILAATGEGLTMLRGEQVLGTAAFPREGVWLTSLVAYKEQDDTGPGMVAKEDPLRTFLNGRSLWVGTKSEGLWRFTDGEWTQFVPDNSRLPSRAINRMYRVGGRLAICTNAGLVIIPLNSQKYDEFKNKDLGRVSAKTIFPFPDRAKALVSINHLQRKNDFWVASAKGLSRFVSASGLFRSLLNDESGILSKQPDTSGLREEENAESTDNRSEGDAPLTLAGERIWEFFTHDSMIDPEITYPLLSDKITQLNADDSGFTWMIFEEGQLSRLHMVPQPKAADKKYERVEKPEWYHFKQTAPWSGGAKLSGLWSSEGQLFVGTQTEGYYVLNNPGYSGEKATEWDWKHYGELEGLSDKHVIGFAWRRIPGLQPNLAILHPGGLSLFDGKEYFRVDLGGGSLRRYRCIVSDPLGNLWMGSDAGVIRLTPESKVITYTAGTCSFESDKISALAVGSEGKATGIALWVACDQSDEGSDQPPMVVSKLDASGAPVVNPETGKAMKVVNEADIDGASLHFFDGLIWEKWKVPGVRCMLHEGDFLWMGTNLRLRRLYIPALLP